jgi:acylphosphatase
VRSIELRVTGRVQGVFFRATLRDKAQEAGVNGWVRNEPDGSVAAHLEGPPGPVDELVEWCRQGPSGADVARVVVSDVPETGWEGFSVRRA